MPHLSGGAKLRDGGERRLLFEANAGKPWRALLARPDEGVAVLRGLSEFEGFEFEIAAENSSQGD